MDALNLIINKYVQRSSKSTNLLFLQETFTLYKKIIMKKFFKWSDKSCGTDTVDAFNRFLLPSKHHVFLTAIMQMFNGRWIDIIYDNGISHLEFILKQKLK